MDTWHLLIRVRKKEGDSHEAVAWPLMANSREGVPSACTSGEWCCEVVGPCGKVIAKPRGHPLRL